MTIKILEPNSQMRNKQIINNSAKKHLQGGQDECLLCYAQIVLEI